MTSSLLLRRPAHPPLPAHGALPPGVTVHRCRSGAVTPTSVQPVAPPLAVRHRRLAVPDALVQRLGGLLPAPWLLTGEDDPLLEVTVTDDGRPEHVRAILREHPGSTVLALVPGDAPAGAVVELLEAGADGCLRDGHPRVVLAQIGALERRTARSA